MSKTAELLFLKTCYNLMVLWGTHSQPCFSLDALLIYTPFLRVCGCTPFLVPLPLHWRGNARHPYLPQFLPPACESGILFSLFAIIPILPLIQEVEEGDKEMGNWGERNIAR